MNKRNRTPLIKVLTATVCGLLLLTGAAWAETFVPIDRDAVMAALPSVNAAKYPDADVVPVEQYQFITYNTDGTHRLWYESYTKVLTEKGRRRMSTLTSTFTIPYNTTRFTSAELIKGDGTVIPLDIEGGSRVMIDKSQMDSNIYNPNARKLQLSVPGIEIGDTVHYTLVDDFEKVRLPDSFSDFVNFEGGAPIVRYTYRVVAPRALPLARIALKSEIPGTIEHSREEKEDTIVYTWTARDVPQAFAEPNMPAMYTQTQRLLVSTISDWKEISRWYWNLSRPHIEDTTPGMIETVKRITAGIEAPAEKIRALFRWVSQDVRYLGLTVEKDSPGYEPHPVSMTFNDRAGVCRDKAALLVSMLRIAGFEAYPVLHMNGPKKDPEVPQPFFNHAVSAVRNPDGSYLLMDSTDESTKEIFPEYLNNQSYLVAHPEGETLRTSPVQSAENNLMKIHTKGALDKDGNLTAETELAFEGINDNVYRGYFAQVSAEKIRVFFESVVKRIAPGAELTSYAVEPENMQDTSRPLVVKLGFSARRIPIRGEDVMMLPLIGVGKRVGMVNFLLDKMSLEQRKYTLLTNYACGFRETFEIDPGESLGKIISLPDFHSIDSGGVLWTRSLSMKDGIWHGSNRFELQQPEYSPDEYRMLKEALKKIETNNRRMMVLENPAGIDAAKWYSALSADAVVLRENSEVHVIDAHNWNETGEKEIKVLTYAGMKRYGELYIPFNPVWEEVEVEYAKVVSPKGDVSLIQEKEINLMDAGWVGKAPRYPAARIMVLSLPGVTVGSTISYKITRKKRNRPFFALNGHLTDNRTMGHSKPIFTVDGAFRTFDPILEKTLTISLPRDLHVNPASADNGLGLEGTGDYGGNTRIHKTVETDGNRVRHTFTASRIAQVRFEDNLPPWYSFNPFVFASSGNWKAYGKAVSKALEGAAKDQPEAVKAALALKSAAGDGEKLLGAIRDFAATRVHKVEIPLSALPLTQITPSDKTLADGYGNPADRAVLLFAMLGAAGFQPEFVLAAKGPHVESLARPLERFPTAEWFSTVLVRVKTEAGYIYLNDTDQYAALGTTAHDGAPGLLAASGEPVTIAALSPEFRDRTDVSISMELSADGGVTARFTKKIYGTYFAKFKKRYSEMPPEKRRRKHLALVADISRAAIPTGDFKTDYTGYPGIREFSVKIPEFAIRQGDFLYMRLPGIQGGLSGVSRDRRNYPLHRKNTTRYRVTEEITLPAGTNEIPVTPPENALFTIPGAGNIAMKTVLLAPLPGTENDNRKRLVVTQEIDLEPVVVPRDAYGRLLEIHGELSHPAARTLMVKPAP